MKNYETPDRHAHWAHRRFAFDQESQHPGHRHGPRGFGPGFGPEFGPWFGYRGRGGRGRRGDVRAAILLLLAGRPMHGYELIQQIRERSEDLWRPSPGSIYPALSQLEDEGLLSIEKIAGRKTAELTVAGIEYVETHRDEIGDPFAEVTESVGPNTVNLRALVKPLMLAMHQVASEGTPAQARKAAEVLTEARKSLYRILAEDEPDTE